MPTFTLTDHDDFTVTGVPDGLTWTATADGTVTNPIPGEGEKTVNAVTSFHIFDADGKDVTSYFTNIDLSATGTLSIKQGLPAGPGKTGEYWATVYHQAYGYEVDENTHIYIASLTGTVLTLTELTNDRRIPGDHAVWCNAEMMHLKEVPDYAYRDFWSLKPKAVRWFYRLLSYVIAPLSVCVFNNVCAERRHAWRRLLQDGSRVFHPLRQGLPDLHRPHYSSGLLPTRRRRRDLHRPDTHSRSRPRQSLAGGSRWQQCRP